MKAQRAAALVAALVSGCAFTTQRPVPPGWQPVDDEPACDAHLGWIAIDALLSAPALAIGATDIGAGSEGRPTNYALVAIGALHLVSGAYGLVVRGTCKRAKVEARESAVGSLRQAERWWTRQQPCPDGASLREVKYEGLQCQRPDGVRHGRSIEFAYGSETLRQLEYTYREGALHGPFREWHYNTEQLASQGEYRDGALLLGRLRQWDRAGRAVVPNYGTGLVARWSGDVKLEEGTYVDGLPDGEWTVWNERGDLVEHGTYASGLRTGAWSTFRDGVERERVHYQVGLEQGEVTRWGADGQVTETGSYYYGRADGVWRYFDAAGRVAMQGSFSNGERHGEWIYYDAGAKVEKGWFDKGLRVGVWVRWDASGAVVDERQYRQGQLVATPPGSPSPPGTAPSGP